MWLARALALFLEQVKAAAAEGAVVELKLRLLQEQDENS